MNEYYYLNEEKKPCGPHTFDEIQALLATGKLTAETPAACKGSRSWTTLGALVTAGSAPVASGEPVGLCPRCGTELSTEQDQLPERCPNCRYLLRARNIHDLLQNFLVAVRKTFVLRGRAPRIEFWSFILFSFLLTFAVQTIMQIVTTAALPPEVIMQLENSENSLFSLPNSALTALLLMGLVCTILNLLITITQTTVTVRRLHDTGRSGKWVLAHLLLILVATGGIVAFFHNVYSESERIREAEYIITDDGWQHRDPSAAERTEQEPIIGPWIAEGFGSAKSQRILLFAFILPMGLAGLTALYIFILTLLDSHRGPNKYGPSPKYPIA